ncbi:hypothetical protein WICPIJ_008437 [Wickerhamomyces pijperi]|uniref:Holocytochrome c-type synthase n=1 Tax=Wickerhamomyces pijperi TaxID=599730 RepID=A0A9P8PZD4_WICPI|nr:hypothetical protein WICPIJ_008437 [Wickerhamomyces pijperi]
MSSSDDQPKCPVDHTQRANWAQNNTTTTSPVVPPHPIPTNSTADKCPVDHNARAKWAELSGDKSAQKQAQAPHPIPEGSSDAKCPVDHTARAKWAELSGDTSTNSKPKVIDGSLIPTAVEHSSDNIPDIPTYTTNVSLPEDREISTIPRTDGSGNWIYPSQKQFFEAMKRKNWNPSAEDMQTVVPIHNAVNERAWFQILKWEEGHGGESCGGVKLSSFKGDSKKLTPKAWFFGLLGYQKPFDRHDWTVDRCGVEVEYVIDFYSGKPNPLMPGMASFYLDVRPKLNNLEGVKMRVMKFLGL